MLLPPCLCLYTDGSTQNLGPFTQMARSLGPPHVQLLTEVAQVLLLHLHQFYLHKGSNAVLLLHIGLLLTKLRFWLSLSSWPYYHTISFALSTLTANP
jgi:hypothetical protein